MYDSVRQGYQGSALGHRVFRVGVFTDVWVCVLASVSRRLWVMLAMLAIRGSVRVGSGVPAEQRAGPLKQRRVLNK